jgi:hypothetical protein
VTAAITSPSIWRKFLRYSFGPSIVRRTNRGCTRAVAVIRDSLSEKGLTANRWRVNCVCLVSPRQSYARSPSSEFLIALERESPNLNASGQLVFTWFPQSGPNNRPSTHPPGSSVIYKQGTIEIL